MPGLLDYLALCWRGRGWIAAVTVLSLAGGSVGLALRPTQYEAEVVLALTPASFAQRIALLVAWGVVPEGTLGESEAVRRERSDEFLRLKIVAPSAAGVRAALDRLVAWIEGERHAAAAEPLAKPPSVVANRPSAEERHSWEAELRRIEARLPRLSPTAAPYWTSRALALHDRIESAPAPPSEPTPSPAPKGEEVAVLQRLPPRSLPKPWAAVLAVAAIAGFAGGVVGVLVQEWWRVKWAARRGAP